MIVEKRLRWFDDGAHKLRPVLDRLGLSAALPDDQSYYACPCCLMAYTREAAAVGLLTVEDVPPRRVGGRPLLLTCEPCNSKAGTAFDSHAAKSSDADDFIRGRVTGRALPATSRVDGIPLRGIAERTDDGIRILGVPRQNDPRIQRAHFDALQAYAEIGGPKPNHSFTIHTQYSETRARISWIRSAYLAAFAALGWSYIFRAVMDPLRTQLQQPGAAILPTYLLREPDASPGGRRILLIDNPDELRCVAVTMGERTIFLPGLFDPMAFQELVDAFASRREAADRLSISLKGKEVPWPRRAAYFLD